VKQGQYQYGCRIASAAGAKIRWNFNHRHMLNWGWHHQEIIKVMSSLQAFALGAMVAWTPGLIVVAWLLWRAPLVGLDENISSESTGNLWSAETRRQKTPGA